MEKYNLIPFANRGKKEFSVRITAEAENSDYIYTTQTYSAEDFDEKVIDAVYDLILNYDGRYALKDYGSKWTEENKFDGILDIPSDDGQNCHTLQQVDITCIDENGVIWHVELPELEEQVDSEQETSEN